MEICARTVGQEGDLGRIEGELKCHRRRTDGKLKENWGRTVRAEEKRGGGRGETGGELGE